MVVLGHLEAACHGLDVQFPEARAVDLAWFLGRAAEETGLEHLQTGNGEALASPVDFARLLAPVGPFRAGAGIEQDGNHEEIDQTTGTLLVVDTRGPRLHELIDARSASHVKVLPPAVWGDGGVVGRIVTL